MFEMIKEVALAIHCRQLGMERHADGFQALAEHFIAAADHANKVERLVTDMDRFEATITSVYIACCVSDGQAHEAHKKTAYAVVGEMGHRARAKRIAGEN